MSLVFSQVTYRRLLPRLPALLYPRLVHFSFGEVSQTCEGSQLNSQIYQLNHASPVIFLVRGICAYIFPSDGLSLD